MRLINFGTGEIVDRLTVLALKIHYGQHVGKPTEHWERERNSLLTKLAARTLNGVWFEYAMALGAVNAALWHAEDRLREWRNRGDGMDTDTFCKSIVDLAFSIQDWNDRRAVLIDKINGETGERNGMLQHADCSELVTRCLCT